MANDLTGPHWNLDSVMATPYSGTVFVRGALWTKQTTIGHRLLVLDRAGRVVWDVVTDKINAQIGLPPATVDGLQVTQIDSGLLIVYMSKMP